MSQTLIYIIGVVGILFLVSREWMPWQIRIALDVIIIHFVAQLMFLFKVDWDSLVKLMALPKTEYWLTIIGVTIALLAIRGLIFRLFGVAR